MNLCKPCKFVWIKNILRGGNFFFHFTALKSKVAHTHSSRTVCDLRHYTQNIWRERYIVGFEDNGDNKVRSNRCNVALVVSCYNMLLYCRIRNDGISTLRRL